MNRQVISQRRHISAVLMLALMSLACLPCKAFERDEFYLGFNTEGFGLAVVPTSMMDNEMLFRSAEAEMDFTMSRDHKEINYYWLASSRSKQYSGTAALRKIIRMGILYRWKASRQDKRSSVHLSTEDNYTQAPFFLIDPDNYNLLVSDDKLILGFRYHF